MKLPRYVNKKKISKKQKKYERIDTNDNNSDTDENSITSNSLSDEAPTANAIYELSTSDSNELDINIRKQSNNNTKDKEYYHGDACKHEYKYGHKFADFLTDPERLKTKSIILFTVEAFCLILTIVDPITNIVIFINCLKGYRTSGPKIPP